MASCVFVVEVEVAPGTCRYTSTNCAPSGLLNVGLRSRVWSLNVTVVPSSMTMKRWMSNAPGWKSGAVGYWKAPGPLSSPVGSVVSNTTVPGVKSNTIVAFVEAVAPLGLVATAVITVVPPSTGMVVEKFPEPSGVTVVVLVA